MFPADTRYIAAAMPVTDILTRIKLGTHSTYVRPVQLFRAVPGFKSVFANTPIRELECEDTTEYKSMFRMDNEMRASNYYLELLHGPYARLPVPTSRTYGPYGRAVRTASAYRAKTFNSQVRKTAGK